MKYHIHIPKLLEFALNVVCDDVTLHGKQSLISPIPYPLYLRCITTYGDKYDAHRYSLYRFYRDVRLGLDVGIQVGRLYPNVLDHVILDDDGVDAELIIQAAQSPLVDDAAASIQRFASRCLAADKSNMMVNALSRVIQTESVFSKAIIDVLLFYGAKLDENHVYYLNRACLRGVNDDVQRCVKRGRGVTEHHLLAAIASGNCDTVRLVVSAIRERPVRIDEFYKPDLTHATIGLMELLLSLMIIQCGKRRMFENIPSFSVLNWILDHDVMYPNDVLASVASNAARYSGHYFDMLRYLVEQLKFTVPPDVLLRIKTGQATDLGVFDYLICHGADVNDVNAIGSNVLEYSTMLIRYWMDNGVVYMKSIDISVTVQSMRSNMTVPVFEMMIDKYSMDINAVGCINGYTALHEACRLNKYEVVEMLLRHGANARMLDLCGDTPYDLTSDDRIQELLRSRGFRHSERIRSRQRREEELLYY